MLFILFKKYQKLVTLISNKGQIVHRVSGTRPWSISVAVKEIHIVSSSSEYILKRILNYFHKMVL